ncbi:MAG: penicillin-binding protein 2 [Planctomycetota bacterium]|nr:penicillin-binding protein 2 [Planctomycetota bacterium]
MIWNPASVSSLADKPPERSRINGDTITAAIFILIGSAFLAVLFRSAWMQLVDVEYWRSVQSSSQVRSSWSHASRGKIYDRQGIVLAEDRLSWKVALDPYSATLVREVATEGERPIPALDRVIEKTFLLPGLQLAKPAQEMASKIRQVASRNDEILRFNKTVAKEHRRTLTQYLYIGTVDAGRDELNFQKGKSALHRELGRAVIPTLEPIVTRHYPHGDTGTLVIGELRGDRQIGLHGIELEYNRLLLERRGLRRQHTDITGRPLGEASEAVPLIDGEDIHLTIGIQEQAILETILADTQFRTEARSVSGIVMDPRTGEVLAIATYPGLVRGELQGLYNKKREADAFDKMLRGSLLSMEPGSVVKPLMLTAALEAGMSLDDPVDVQAKSQRFSGRSRTFTDSHLLRDRTLRGAVVESSNIGIVDIGLKLGEKKVHRILRKFGLGEKTGIDLGREETGQVKSLNLWSWYTLTSASFGYELQVTPLQLIRAYCAIANGGELVTPHVRRKDPDRFERVEPRRVTDETIAYTVRHVMREVVLKGTAKGVLGTIEMAGKTGTAKISTVGGYSEDRYISSFIGFAPWQDPERIALVVVEEPATSNYRYYASKSAAPAVRDILESVLHSSENRVQQRLERVLEIADYGTETAPLRGRGLDTPGRADSLSGQGSARNLQGEGEPDRWNHGEGN